MKIYINPIRDCINMVKKALNDSQFAVCHYTSTREYLMIPRWEEVKDTRKYVLEDILIEEKDNTVSKRRKKKNQSSSSSRSNDTSTILDSDVAS